MNDDLTDQPDQLQLMLHLQIDKRRAPGKVDLAKLICDFPEIIEGMRLSGDSGYWLRVSINQLSQYEGLRDRLIEILPEVRRITASVVLDWQVPANAQVSLPCSGHAG
ncbi:MAG: hypothetical protein B7X90_13395 [Novosphingobium sp. 17-62-19]|uniref:Lrp/AsnC ligand binding domain-containing protein n=1 Tax=Novosphingobium sp. 17-62-19 TaxID=1970406 RepID=UPI000BD0A91E|nr:Lrp/AsnC ligand binding domain-containing protein [Novosphingobium sp. 17-62-19]OZA17935.1 MAG: hypothetical protein B7X90_13395 [Novosphingobium sp. 17-62-19]